MSDCGGFGLIGFLFIYVAGCLMGGPPLFGLLCCVLAYFMLGFNS